MYDRVEYRMEHGIEYKLEYGIKYKTEHIATSVAALSAAAVSAATRILPLRGTPAGHNHATSRAQSDQ